MTESLKYRTSCLRDEWIDEGFYYDVDIQQTIDPDVAILKGYLDRRYTRYHEFEVTMDSIRKK